MKILLDLDYTLLDSIKFKKALAEIFESFDFKDFNFEESYNYLKEVEGENFGLDIFINFLKRNREYKITADQEAKMKAECHELIGHINDFLFPEAEKLLELLKRNGYEIALVTFGRKNCVP